MKMNGFFFCTLFLLYPGLPSGATTRQESTSPSLIEQAERELHSPTPAKGSPAERRSLGVLSLKDPYQAPRVRDYRWDMRLALETLSLRGEAPTSSVGIRDVQAMGTVPVARFALGFWRPGLNGQWGSSIETGYGIGESRLTTPTQKSISAKIHVFEFGASLNYQHKLGFGDLVTGLGLSQWSLRSSSEDTVLAQWKQDSQRMISKLGFRFQALDSVGVEVAWTPSVTWGGPTKAGDSTFQIGAGYQW